MSFLFCFRLSISAVHATNTNGCTPTSSPDFTEPPRSSWAPGTACPSICGAWDAFWPNSWPDTHFCPARTKVTSCRASSSFLECHRRSCWTKASEPKTSSAQKVYFVKARLLWGIPIKEIRSKTKLVLNLFRVLYLNVDHNNTYSLIKIEATHRHGR